MSAAVDNHTLHVLLDRALPKWTSCWLTAFWNETPDKVLGWQVRVVCDLYDTTGEEPELWPHQRVVLNDDPQVDAWLDRCLKQAEPHVLTAQDLLVEDGVSRDGMTVGLLQAIVEQFT